MRLMGKYGTVPVSVLWETSWVELSIRLQQYIYAGLSSKHIVLIDGISKEYSVMSESSSSSSGSLSPCEKFKSFADVFD